MTVPLTQQAFASDGFESSLEVGSEVMAPIYRASGALFPSIYISQAPASAEERRATVLAQVGGAVNASIRLAAGGGPRVPVYPFAWQCYHNGTTLLSYDDLQSELIEPYNAGADGVVVWGCEPPPDLFLGACSLSECVCHADTAGKVEGGGLYSPKPDKYSSWRPYLHYVANETGPLVAQFRQRAGDCARASCSSHGRCTHVAPLAPSEAEGAAAGAPSCSCDPGWGGADCSKRAA